MFFFQKKWLFSGYFRQSENGFLVVILERLTGFSTLKKVGNPDLPGGGKITIFNENDRFL